VKVQTSTYSCFHPCRKPVIPLTGNVIRKNSTGFSNSMYPHVGLYTPYFGFGYKGIRNDPTMWPPISNPLTNPMTSLKLVSIIAQVGIIKDCGEPLDEEMDYLKKKHNPKMPQFVPAKKSYHDWRGRPSPVGDVGRPLISGRIIPIGNDGGGLFQ
jgi:hypothetical protein